MGSRSFSAMGLDVDSLFVDAEEEEGEKKK